MILKCETVISQNAKQVNSNTFHMKGDKYNM